MYLKALEIQGFKSFPDKTILNFGEDITAIVGPNGSGKSNISDAIRWVMGEQSAKGLRGAKMEDVIFGGTEQRNQVGFAQVTLVLDNTERIFPSMEEAEVAVTRRYYRSGESEYYINRQSVRLKDVTELFLDTGLGREGYSIIGQGKIDEILSTRSTASATGRRRRSGSWSGRRRIWSVSMTRSRSWSSRWSPCGIRRRKRSSTSFCGTSCGFWKSPCGWRTWTR